ncbi:hypothetical protein RUND412_005190 [Rhizina undulata]
MISSGDNIPTWQKRLPEDKNLKRAEENDEGTIMGLSLMLKGSEKHGKDIKIATKGISYTAKECYIRQWLGVEEPETFEAREEGLAGAEAEVDSGNASEFSEIPPVVVWVVWQNSRLSRERMDYEYLAQTKIEDNCASQFSEISLGRVWPNSPALRQTEVDYENASKFSEIPLVLVLQNLISGRENTEDLAHTEIEENLLSHMFKPAGYTKNVFRVEGSTGAAKEDDINRHVEERPILKTSKSIWEETLVISGGTFRTRLQSYLALESTPASISLLIKCNGTGKASTNEKRRDEIGDIFLTDDETDNGHSASWNEVDTSEGTSFATGEASEVY